MKEKNLCSWMILFCSVTHSPKQNITMDAGTVEEKGKGGLNRKGKEKQKERERERKKTFPQDKKEGPEQARLGVDGGGTREERGEEKAPFDLLQRFPRGKQHPSILPKRNQPCYVGYSTNQYKS